MAGWFNLRLFRIPPPCTTTKTQAPSSLVGAGRSPKLLLQSEQAQVSQLPPPPKCPSRRGDLSRSLNHSEAALATCSRKRWGIRRDKQSLDPRAVSKQRYGRGTKRQYEIILERKRHGTPTGWRLRRSPELGCPWSSGGAGSQLSADRPA